MNIVRKLTIALHVDMTDSLVRVKYKNIKAVIVVIDWTYNYYFLMTNSQENTKYTQIYNDGEM